MNYTHKVLDLHYSPEEGQDCFTGTAKDCMLFLEEQTAHFMYEIVPLTEEEQKIVNDKQYER